MTTPCIPFCPLTTARSCVHRNACALAATQHVRNLGRMWGDGWTVCEQDLYFISVKSPSELLERRAARVGARAVRSSGTLGSAACLSLPDRRGSRTAVPCPLYNATEAVSTVSSEVSSFCSRSLDVAVPVESRPSSHIRFRFRRFSGLRDSEFCADMLRLARMASVWEAAREVSSRSQRAERARSLSVCASKRGEGRRGYWLPASSSDDQSRRR